MVNKIQEWQVLALCQALCVMFWVPRNRPRVILSIKSCELLCIPSVILSLLSLTKSCRVSFKYFFLSVPHVHPSGALHGCSLLPLFPGFSSLRQMPSGWPSENATSIKPHHPSHLKIIPCLPISWSDIQDSPYSDSKWPSWPLFCSSTRSFFHARMTPLLS